MTEFNLEKQGDKKYTWVDVSEIIRKLIAPDGCPWDREQTHQTIRRNMIEEAYEAVDAIDSGDSHRLKDELGDVLLQVFLHSAIAEKSEEFVLDDVTDNLCRKLISRHTHVFGNDEAKTGEDGYQVWEKNKMKEKKIQKYSDSLSDLPTGLPALMRADKMQKRASKAGFDWSSAEGALEKIQEEITEIEDALLLHQHPKYQKVDEIQEPELHEELEKEMGDLLFSVVNYSRLMGVDSEVALSRCNEKFLRRFQRVEELAEEEGRVLAEMTLVEMDALWDIAKQEGL